MEILISFISEHLPKFFFVLLRTSIFISMMPVFGAKNQPAQFKAGFAVALALILTPVVNVDLEGVRIPLVIVREIILGMALGLSVRFVFFAVTMGGQMMTTAMHLRAGNVFDPEYGSSGEVSRLFGVIATLLFFALDIHHDMIYIFVKSFDIVPAGQINVGRLVEEAMSLGSRMFSMALKMAAPMLLGSLMISVIVGFMNKASPQINLLIISFPIHIFVGISIIVLCIPVLINFMSAQFMEAREEMYKMLLLAKG